MNQVHRIRLDVSMAQSLESIEQVTYETLEQQVIAAIRRVYDPEIPVNVYDLGLIYDLRINSESEVFVDMTLTAPACPVAGILPGQVATAIKQVKSVRDATVNLVWNPPWSKERISDEAKLILGIM